MTDGGPDKLAGTAQGDAVPGVNGACLIAFGPFRIDCARRRLTRDGRRLTIQRKPLDVLIHLSSCPGRVVSRRELLKANWGNAVHEESLTRCISIVRKLLDDVREPPRYIETVWGEGYRFIAPVEIVAKGGPAAADFLNPNATVGIWGALASGIWRRLRYAVLAGLLITAALVFRNTGENRSAPPIEHLAVLPMAVEVESDRWIAEALTDHLTGTLSRIEGIRVVGRGSADRFAHDVEPAVIGRQLKVGSVLASQLLRSGDLAVVRAQLIGTADGVVLWNYSVGPTAIEAEPALAELLIASIIRRLWANLSIPGGRAEVDAQAYRHFLRGRYFWNQRSPTGLLEAIAAFEAALAIDPAYVDASVGLAESWLLMPLYSATPPTRATPHARQAANRALDLDPRTARAHAVLGVVAMQYDWDWLEAERRLRQAMTLDPNDVTAEQWLAELYCLRHRFAECRAHLDGAAGLDPLSPVLRMLQGSPALHGHDFAAAVDAYQRALRQAPGVALTRYSLGLAYAGMADWPSAIETYYAAIPELGLEIVGGPLVHALARSGHELRARQLLAELEQLAAERYIPPSKFAVAWLGLGDRRRALECLEQAVRARDDRLVYLAVDAHFRELHADPRFQVIAERVGLLDLIDRR